MKEKTKSAGINNTKINELREQINKLSQENQKLKEEKDSSKSRQPERIIDESAVDNLRAEYVINPI